MLAINIGLCEKKIIEIREHVENFILNINGSRQQSAVHCEFKANSKFFDSGNIVKRSRDCFQKNMSNDFDSSF